MRARRLCAVVSLCLCVSLLTVVGSTARQQRAPAAPTAAPPTRALLDQYCVGCHNQRSKTAGVAFDTMDITDVSRQPDIWEKAIRKLRGGLMPPPGARQPEHAVVESFVSSLETALDQAAAKSPNPGGVTLHRLNRAEYANSMHELFGIDVDAGALLPADDISDGFDNIANVLKVSPSFLDQYINAARAVSRQAIGEAPSPSNPARVLLRGTLDQNPYIEGGLPLGTQPVMLTEHLFPADGEYEFQINGAGIVTVDGSKVATTGRVPVKAGLHKVGLATPQRSFVESDNTLQSFIPGGGAGFGGGGGGGRGGRGGVPDGAVQVVGPYTPASSLMETQNRQKIFICKPANEADELPCATKILSNIARLAFRRPVTDRDLAAPLAFFKDGKSTGNFESGIQTGLMAILASPKFLYRAEPAPANAAPGTIFKINDLELASRLSFFLWSQGPDQTLLDLAVQKKLSDPAILEQQVKRMLADPRSKSLVTNFAFEWLKVRDLDKIDPDAVLFPNFDQSLKQAFRREMEMFVESIIREDRSVMDLVTADYTFVNERLAAHYGIPDVRGDAVPARHADRFESLRPARQRRGVAGHVVSQSHVFGAAWRLDSGEHPGNAAGSAASGCRRFQGKQGRREAEDGARDHGTASCEAIVQRMPRSDGSARICAGKLRRHRRMANQGSLGRNSDRCVRQARRWNAGQQPERSAKGARKASRSVCSNDHRED